MHSGAGGRIQRLILVFLIGFLLAPPGARAQSQGPGAKPVTQLWRNDLVDVAAALDYHATAAFVDASNNLFVGGSVTLRRGFVQEFPYIAKFDPAGTKQWEHWTPSGYPELVRVEGMTSDGRGGVHAALGISTGGVQLVSIWTPSWTSSYLADYWERLTNCALWSLSSQPANSVHLAADGQGGFYLAGLFASASTNGSWEFALAHYDQQRLLLWQTNLFRGFFTEAGLERALVATSNSLYFCGLGVSASRLVKVGTDGAVRWMGSSRPYVSWTQLAVSDDETVCVAGAQNFEVWSGLGQRLASHGAGDFSVVARQSPDAEGFLVSDCWSANLLRLDRQGVMRKLGQLPAAPTTITTTISPPAIINLGPDEWLLAINCPEDNSANTNNLSLFQFGQNGELKWRQRLPGFEYTRLTYSKIPNHWLLKASDHSIRLVANLSDSSGNPHTGVAVAAFSITNQYAAPVLTNSLPCITNLGPEGTLLQLQATGTGPLAYQWYFAGRPLYGQTAATLAASWPGVYCARIMDANGEMFSPAISVLNTNGVYQSMQQDSTDGPVLTLTPGTAVQFQMETSTNLTDWVLDPVVYSSMNRLPTSLLAPAGSTPEARFFRPRFLPRP